jgi:hypothetical protein
MTKKMILEISKVFHACTAKPFRDRERSTDLLTELCDMGSLDLEFRK